MGEGIEMGYRNQGLSRYEKPMPAHAKGNEWQYGTG